VALGVVVIADAGPLLHLHWIGALAWALPPQPIVIVEAVAQELERYAPEILEAVPLVRVANPGSIPPALDRWRLDDGERYSLAHALVVARARPVLVLTDDRRARQAADELGVDITGTVGLLLQALVSGRAEADQVRDALIDLPGKGRLYLSNRLLAWAIAEVDAFAGAHLGDE
jgi:predicted nucleic acid-binding protein